ncbi:MAG TPA: tRNA (adenosine(37)-N6)-threonylcarbamoyltransferase complex ATPase subunit type 1 TsaE [Bryobacteraceae bacterium]|nr:tRNA (adenosine(37)-N6)-threonylcarbamoyltransferase complex ATPase subunit type 1 TsaE [Bryobacteraceae bacterium]HPT26683.1 tRNA (adenosine(37)-N6)-threonylcarbamoyltransferase complex ATPase subunit type 1 TsaE [Bryobacteraceae bacterium]
MKCETFNTDSEQGTVELGRTLALRWPRPCVVLLIGALGAGKTTLAKGLVAGTGAAHEDDVSSPTFPLIHEYGDPVSVYHIDLYRLDTIAEVERIGLDEILDRPALILLEWAERFPKLLPARRVEIRIQAGDDEVRSFEVTEYGF